MSILTVKNLSHGYGARTIFSDVSFRLLKGEHIGLVGANGEGKSTFMNILTDKLEPDEGTVEWSKRVRVGYLDQHAQLEPEQTVNDVLKGAYKYLFDLDAEMNSIYERMGEMDPDEMTIQLEEAGTIQDILDHNDFYIIDSKIQETSKGIGLIDIGLEKKVSELSGGQRTKVLLGKLLLEKPDILLLDEPTNFLDEEHINWLTRYLNSYENAFILISHDIPFLNSVINIIYHMDAGALDRYVGDYHNYKRIYEVKKKQIEAAYKQQQKEISSLEDFVARNKARVATRNMAMSRQKKLDKMDVIELKKEKPKPEFRFLYGRTPSRILYETKDLVIGYDKPLSRPLNLFFERNRIIALTGANGIGKTTLLRSLLGELDAISGSVHKGENLQVGYFEQESKPNYNTCIEEFWEEFPSLMQVEVRSALAKCGLTTDHIESKIVVLSGGEQAKVKLCKLMNRETNLLVLDEPTNHLDVEAKEELARALKAYKGTIILISHEPDFYNEIATEVWNCEDWTTMAF